MVSIRIDEKACVGCTLCVETCRTGVFSFDEEKRVPTVAKPLECFGCLSCSEICPAGAIYHGEVVHAENFYHDPYALDLATRLLGEETTHQRVMTEEAELKSALSDLGVRLLSVASVFKQTLGGGLPAVGTMAGRTLAGQLPRYRLPKDFAEVLDLAREQFAPTWELTFSTAGDQLTIGVGKCFVRDLCGKEGLPLGQELCVLFYNYLAGYLSRMGNVRPRLVQAERGEKGCRYEIKLY